MIALVALFVRHEARTAEPMLDLSVFRNPRFAGASLAVTAVYFCLFGTFFLLTQHLQLLLGYGPLAAGLRTVPFAAVLIVGGQPDAAASSAASGRGSRSSSGCSWSRCRSCCASRRPPTPATAAVLAFAR